jgi:Protein of unknown function (DUF732)
MTEHQDDTMAAAEVSGNSETSDPETTIVATDTMAAPLLAWGTEVSDDELNERLSPPLRHPWTRALAIAAGVLALGTVAAVVVATSGRHGNDLRSALPVTVHSSAAAPVLSAPVMPDIHHVGPAPAPATVLAVPAPPVDKDARFLALIGPLQLDPKYMDRITGYAHDVCRSITDGDITRTGEIARLLKNTDLTTDQATAMVNTAIEVYCPQFTDTGPAMAAPGPAPSGPDDTAPPTLPLVFTAAQDESFLAKLQRYHVSIASDPAAAINMGHWYCQKLWKGETVDQASRQVQEQTGMNSTDILQFTSSAIVDYHC